MDGLHTDIPVVSRAYFETLQVLLLAYLIRSSVISLSFVPTDIAHRTQLGEGSNVFSCSSCSSCRFVVTFVILPVQLLKMRLSTLILSVLFAGVAGKLITLHQAHFERRQRLVFTGPSKAANLFGLRDCIVEVLQALLCTSLD